MNWILDEVVESLKNRLNTLEKMMLDPGFMPIYRAAMKQEIIWLKQQLAEIEEMKLEEVKLLSDAEEDARDNRAYSRM